MEGPLAGRRERKRVEMQSLSREPFSKAIAIPQELGHLIAAMRDSDGLCACGRYLSSLDAKFILVNPIMKLGKMAVAAYCFECFNEINDALKRCRDRGYREKRPEADLRG